MWSWDHSLPMSVTEAWTGSRSRQPSPSPLSGLVPTPSPVKPSLARAQEGTDPLQDPAPTPCPWPIHSTGTWMAPRARSPGGPCRQEQGGHHPCHHSVHSRQDDPNSCRTTPGQVRESEMNYPGPGFTGSQPSRGHAALQELSSRLFCLHLCAQPHSPPPQRAPGLFY